MNKKIILFGTVMIVSLATLMSATFILPIDGIEEKYFVISDYSNMNKSDSSADEASEELSSSNFEYESSEEETSEVSDTSEESQVSEEPDNKESSEEESSSKEQPKKPEEMKINAAGDYSEKADTLKVEILSGGVNLSNKNINGDLIIKAKSGNGDINISNVNVSGSIYIESLGGNINFNNVTAKELGMDPQKIIPVVRISGFTQFGTTYINSSSKLVQSNLSPDAKGYAHIGLGGYTGQSMLKIELEKITNTNMTVNYPADINLSDGTYLNEVYGGNQCRFHGLGKIVSLYVNSNGISHEGNIDNISYFGTFEKVLNTKEEHTSSKPSENSSQKPSSSSQEQSSDSQSESSENQSGQTDGENSQTEVKEKVRLKAPKIESIYFNDNDRAAVVFNVVDNAEKYYIEVRINDKKVEGKYIMQTDAKDIYYEYKGRTNSGDKIKFIIKAKGNGMSTEDSVTVNKDIIK